MVSKRWQRKQSFIAHVGLFLGFGLPMFLLEIPLDVERWQKIAILFIGYAVLIPGIRWLHRRFAKQFVKVFELDYLDASWIVSRSLRAKNLPFVKRVSDDEVVFKIQPGKIKLVVSDFALNLMIDDHLTTKIATLFTLEPEKAGNFEQVKLIQQLLDDAFALQAG